MSGGYSHSQLITVFERIACVTPPKQYYQQVAFPAVKFNGGVITKNMRTLLVDCLKTQKVIKFQSDLKALVEKYPKVAEVHVFKAEIEMAIMKPEVAIDTLNEGLRQKAEPLELLRDVHFVLASYLNKARNSQLKPVILRKPRNDPYTAIYKIDARRMDEVELMLQYLIGGPAIFEELPEEPVKKVPQKATVPVKEVYQEQIQKKTANQPQIQPVQPQLKQTTQKVSFQDQLLQKKQQQIAQIQSVKQSAYQEENIAINQIKQQEQSQPSNQLLEYMKKKNIVKRSNVTQDQCQKQQNVEQPQDLNLDTKTVIQDVKAELQMDDVDVLRRQEIDAQVQQQYMQRPIEVIENVEVEDAEVIVSAANVNIIKRSDNVRDNIINEINNCTEYEALDLHNSMKQDQVEVVKSDDFDDQEDEEDWGYKEELAKSINTLKNNKNIDQTELKSVFDIQQSQPDYLSK